MSATGEQLLDVLSREQLISTHERHALSGIAASADGNMDLALRRLGTIPDARLCEIYKRSSLYPFIDLDSVPLEQVAYQHFAADLLRDHKAVPLNLSGAEGVVSVASLTPADLAHRDAVQSQLHGVELKWFRCSEHAFERLCARVLPDVTPLQQLIEAGDDNAVAVFDQLILQAVTQRASDIHLQPESGFARIRLRIDGVLETAGLVSMALCTALGVRIKVLAELDIADSRSTQDGQFSAVVCGSEHRFRVSVLPTDCGESIVVRVLASDQRAPSLDSLGLAMDSVKLMHAALARQDGLILMAGPTGSGKTTTLHAMVEHLREPGCNIITLEDPVEYTAPWLRQTSVQRNGGIDYAQAIKAALRQDPDVLLIGEIRDADSARNAWRAAMTGHRVLSTVHATGALAALPRLLDLGIAPDFLASQLVAVIAQRLMRRICGHCAPTCSPPFQHAAGCPACRQRGYLGRFAVAEVLCCDTELSHAIELNRSRAEIEEKAARVGFVPMAEHAWHAVLAGNTTVDEYRRVIGPPPRGAHCD